jgi:hypothetical protein
MNQPGMRFYRTGVVLRPSCSCGFPFTLRSSCGIIHLIAGLPFIVVHKMYFFTEGDLVQIALLNRRWWFYYSTELARLTLVK